MNLSDDLSDTIRNNALTVAEAVDVEPGYWITVKGFIVAAAESSIKNADFRSPFAGKTAILLADEPSDGTDEQVFECLLPVSLSDAAKGISTKFNLQDNANRWNNYVYLHGIRKQYMSAPGIKELTHIWVDDSYRPEPSTDPEDTEDTDDNPDSPEVNDGGDSDALTVSAAIAAYTYSVVKVKGYIVGTTKKSMSNAVFDDINEDYTAILLADAPNERDTKLLLPVGTPKAIREQLSAYGADLKNMRVIAIGQKDMYLGQPGIKQTKSVTMVP